MSFVREGLDRRRGGPGGGARAGGRTWLRSFFGDEPAVQVARHGRRRRQPGADHPGAGRTSSTAPHQGRGVRGIGEPVWAERSAGRARRVPAARVAAQPRVRVTAGVAAAVPVRRCRRCRGSVLDQARATHPVVGRRDRAQRASATYHRVPPQRALRGDPLPPPAETPVELPFTDGELASVRRLVRRQCAEVGLADDARRRPRARGRRGRGQQPAARRRSGRAAGLDRGRLAGLRGHRRGRHRRPARRPPPARRWTGPAAAGCGSPTSSATWCRSAPARPAPPCACTCAALTRRPWAYVSVR